MWHYVWGGPPMGPDPDHIRKYDECENCLASSHKIKYRLVNSEHTKLIVDEYGKNSLRKTADNLSDIFLSLR